ncbi:TlpA disulfide reductase family protein [Spongiivirga sp. MCCC 1A20706]|uniref:TlpA family protein disulfide reductase n=1 Tax=Spongiivirga sp. MCCC 1A20706 TaxID=3160963 RepID=UPI0039773217
MKNIIRISMILMILLLACKESVVKKKQSTTEKQATISKEVRNEVVFILKDTIDQLQLSIISEKNQMKQDLISIGTKYSNDTLIIPTDSVVKLLTGYKHLFAAKAVFKKGDSVNIFLKDTRFDGENFLYPYFQITNGRSNPYETNFDFFVNKQTPTFSTFRVYSIFSRIREKEKLFTINDVYENTLRMNDSLFKSNLVSEKFYNFKIAESKAFKAFYAVKYKTPNWEQTLYEKYNFELSDFNPENVSPLTLENYAYYSYLKHLLINSNFQKKVNRISSKEIVEHVLNRDSILTLDEKTFFLNSLLKEVYASDKSNFSELLVLLKKSGFDNGVVLSKRFQDIITYEKRSLDNFAKFKKDAGKLLSSKYSISSNFQDILAKHKGNLIVVDFWASWCAPCRKQMPALRNIKKEYKDLNFSVISISIDENPRSWEKAAKQEKLWDNDDNYFLLDFKNSVLKKKLQINTIPRYLIYDKKGKLVNADAPSPDNEELKIVLEKLLKKKSL